jgi:hypothetical protein
MFCFSLLNAALYENLAANYLHIYGYGRSLITVGSVPLSVPIFEFLVVYAGLKITEKMGIRAWIKPFLVGLMAMIADFSLDPVSVKQVFTTASGVISRWTWFTPAGHVNIFSEPVYNFTGWVLICGYGAAFLLLGRYWFKKTNYKPLIGYIYPFITMIAAFLLLITPLSSFLLWLGPIFKQGSFSEWIMLTFWFILPTILLFVTWKRKMIKPLTIKGDLPLIILFAGMPIINILFTIIGGYTQILWLEVLSALIPIAFILFLLRISKKANYIK